MDQDRLGNADKQAADIKNEPGWQQSAGYILEKIDNLTKEIRENRLETCKKLDKLSNENRNTHKLIFDKLDTQKDTYVAQQNECRKAFVPARTFNWFLIVLIVVLGGAFSISGASFRQANDNKTELIKYKAQHEIKCDDVSKRVEKLEKIHPIHD